MTEQYPVANYELSSNRVRARRSRAWVVWMLWLATMALAAAFIWKVYLPLRLASSEANQRADRGEARGRVLAAQLKKKDAELASARKTHEQLQVDLADQVAAKDAAVAELKRLQEELSSNLEVEIESGDVRIARRGSELVVDVADKILFDTGAVDVNERGQQVLRQVAATLRQMPGFHVRVGGHTDSARVVSPELRERFPTNWELSTARATHVVRFMQDQGKLSGERLIAAGFAQFRPIASNASDEGRRKNRRIEIVLLTASAGQR